MIVFFFPLIWHFFCFRFLLVPHGAGPGGGERRRGLGSCSAGGGDAGGGLVQRVQRHQGGLLPAEGQGGDGGRMGMGKAFTGFLILFFGGKVGVWAASSSISRNERYIDRNIGCRAFPIHVPTKIILFFWGGPDSHGDDWGSEVRSSWRWIGIRPFKSSRTFR